MATRQQRLDRAFIERELRLEHDLSEAFGSAGQEIGRVLNANASAGQLQNTAEVRREAVAIIAALFAGYTLLLRNAQEDIARTRVTTYGDLHLPELRELGATRYANKVSGFITSYPERVSNSLEVRRTQGITVGARITTVKQGTERTVRNIINNGVRDGLHPNQMAAKISQYMRPTSRGATVLAWREARKASGLKASQRPAMRSQNALYNAVRIARTESAATFRRATVDFYRDGVLAELFDWVLSNTHPAPDQCDSYANQGPYKAENVPSEPHPHCLCDVQARPVSVAQLKRNLVEAGEITA